MTDIVSSLQKIQQEAVDFKSPISENILTTIGSTSNAIIDDQARQDSDLADVIVLIESLKNAIIMEFSSVATTPTKVITSGVATSSTYESNFYAPKNGTVKGVRYEHRISIENDGLVTMNYTVTTVIKKVGVTIATYVQTAAVGAGVSVDRIGYVKSSDFGNIQSNFDSVTTWGSNLAGALNDEYDIEQTIALTQPSGSPSDEGRVKIESSNVSIIFTPVTI